MTFSLHQAFLIAAESDPDVALLDMLSMVTLGRIFFEEEGPSRYGKMVVPVIEGYRKAEADIRKVATIVLTPESDAQPDEDYQALAQGKSRGKIFSADPVQQFCRRSARIHPDQGRRHPKGCSNPLRAPPRQPRKCACWPSGACIWPPVYRYYPVCSGICG